MRNIKNLIFDLGGVIIDIDPNLTIQAFKEAGVEDIDTVYTSLKKSNRLTQIETGEISFEVLYNEFIAESAFHIEKGTFIKCWNTLLLDIPEERILLLKELNRKYNQFLLSNTNPVHMEAINLYISKNYSINLSDLFKTIYLSFEHAVCKPAPEIFLKILRENNLKPEETLFFDDTEIHIESAVNLGINTALVTPQESILEHVRSLGL